MNMSSSETESGRQEIQFGTTSILELIAGPVAIGVVLGLISPFMEATVTYGAGITIGVASALVAGIVLLVVMFVATL